MLGDGHIESFYRPEIARLKVAYRAAHQEYVYWLYKEFKEWALTKPRIREVKGFGKIYEVCEFSTVSHKDFAVIWRKWYRNKKKIIPKNEAYKLTPLGLAIWFMDDGSIKSKRHKSLFLNTQGFSSREVTLLQNVLETNFGIRSSTRKDKNGLQIYISKENAVRFKEIIDPYVLDLMRYKLSSGANRMPKM